MSTLSISQAAQILKVNKKTLMRWDASGKFPAIKDPKTGARSYDEKDIQDNALWFEIRRKHKAHNRKLSEIRKEADKFTATIPLNFGEKLRVLDGKAMKKAYDALNKWSKEDIEIQEEYLKIPSKFHPRVDPES